MKNEIKIKINTSEKTQQKKEITKIFNEYKMAKFKMNKLEELIELMRINKKLPPGIKLKLTFSPPSYIQGSSVETVVCNLENLELYYKQQEKYVQKVDQCLLILSEQEQLLLKSIFFNNTNLSIIKTSLEKLFKVHRNTGDKIMSSAIKKFLKEWNHVL